MPRALIISLCSLAALLVVTAVLTFRSRRISERSKRQVEAWANHAKYRLMRAERRSSLKSPFSFSLSHTVYQVTVDDNGRFRHGWLRCGRQQADAPRYARVEVRWAD